MDQSPSAVEAFRFRGRNFFVKRDDTIDPLLSGNKYRKLYSLLQTPSQLYTKIYSYGGTQSNAMLSIAALCHHKGWEFHYTVKKLPSYGKANLSGNLKMALEFGMRLHEVEDYDEAVSSFETQMDNSTLLIPQGGAGPLAQQGIEVLAGEIGTWQREQIDGDVTIVTPSGTGTTAYYLAQALPQCKVVTTAAVGDKEYLLMQIEKLGEYPDNLEILQSQKKYHFGKPYEELLAMHRELKQNGIEFDLLYAAKMWIVLLENVHVMDGEILYVHSGGIIGNQTMLQRYAYKGFC